MFHTELAQQPSDAGVEVTVLMDQTVGQGRALRRRELGRGKVFSRARQSVQLRQFASPSGLDGHKKTVCLMHLVSLSNPYNPLRPLTSVVLLGIVTHRRSQEMTIYRKK